MTPKDVVNKLYECYSAGDLSGVALLLAEDVLHTSHPDNMTAPFCGRYQGKEAFLQRMHALATRLQIELYEPVTIIVDGEDVAAISRVAGTSRRTGTAFDTQTALFITVTDGRITQIQEFFDTALVAAMADVDGAA